MNVYIAGPWTRRQDAANLAAKIEALGHHVVHDWWNKEAGDEEHEELQRLAGLDVFGVLMADTFILLNLEKSEGKAVETGIALTAEKRLIGVGPQRYTHIFHHLAQWEWCETVEQLLDLLQ